MSRIVPLMFMVGAACTPGSTSSPGSDDSSPTAPTSSADDGAAKRLHLIFTGHVHGEIEPCG